MNNLNNTNNYFVGEVWKEYVFRENTTSFRLEVSNFGRIKTYTKFHPEGKIIKGTQVQGYPYVRVTFYKDMEQKYKDKLQPLTDEIRQITSDIRKLKKEDVRTQQTLKYQTTLQKLIEKKEKLSQRKKKYAAKYTRKSYKQVGLLIHKGVAELFLEKPSQEHKFVIHLDWNKQNNHFTNLAWATQEDVTQHQFSNPRIELQKFKDQLEGVKRKPNTKMGKLTETEVLFIKRKLKKGETLRSLARRFNVSDMQIHRIKTGENWGHLKEVSEMREELKKE